MKRETARKYWASRKEYPRFGSRLRRFYELQWLVPKLGPYDKRILDIGCGSGEFLSLLTKCTELTQFYGCDFSRSLLKKVPDDISTFYYNIYTGHAPLSGKPFDVVLLWAVLQYVFDDKAIKNLLSHLNCQKLFIRTPIGDGEQIEKYSEELGAMYSSRYFELEPLLGLIGEYFTVQEVARVYPDEIESKFGTKQWVIAAVTK